jgi:predicted nucleic acid-binding protein
MRAPLDTSVLIGIEDSGALEAAISSASLAELHFGVLVASDGDERARRALRLGVIESTFEPLPIDAAVAREWGRLAAGVRTRGDSPGAARSISPSRRPPTSTASRSSPTTSPTSN